ncbi:MAG TPA: phosphatase PAP2 family protein [Methanotrichaceae archaeon]|nr:phosphatase PAP2 family protein [Methanotrichaceae archaeon]
MKLGFGGILLMALLLILAAGPAAGANTPSMQADEPTGGQWSTILSGDSVTLDPPPTQGSKLAASEIEELRELQAKRTPEIIKTIEHWDGGSVVGWNEIARDLVIKHKTDPPMASRAYALLSVAQYDALVAAWKNKYKYGRISPAEADLDIYPFVSATKDPVYPSEHAVVASASAEVLKYLYPDEASYLDGKAKEDEESRLWAGTNYRSDLTAGRDLGKAVAGKVISRAMSDRSDLKGSLTMPTGPGYWTGTNPTRPLWGKVTPWLMGNASQFRPVPPPAYGSAEYEKALSEVRSISDHRTPDQVRIAQKWADGAGTSTPPGHWNQIASQMIGRYHLNELRSARALALMNMAMMDAGICCWDTKYHYCLCRPWQADPKITTTVAKPNFPSYTSGHSDFSAAASEVLGYIFPREKDTLNSMAEEAGISRLYGGIHYRFDIEQGAEDGRRIGQLAIQRGMEDGSPQQ